MEYATMLSAPDLVSGLCDLLADPDPAVVKRTIRVFANVYRHALQLLATGDLDEATFTGAWPAVRSVADLLTSMLATTENEGVIVHIVRFLEAAIVAHLLSDINRYPELAVQGPKIIDKEIAALIGLVKTPYVGGSVFIVAVRALITVACYKRDLWQPVTDLIQKKIISPPPTLFDHNVRSLKKTLQRNLFRLLRRANTPALRGQLIEMMVSVGVPRRLLSQWAPPQETRKRPPQTQSDDAITGRSTPPNKKAKQESDTSENNRKTPPRDPREVRDPRVMTEPRDPRTSARADPRLTPPPRDPRASPTQDLPTKPNTPPSSGRSTPENPLITKTLKESSSNFEFLKNLITSTKNISTPFIERCSEKERALYERLDHPHVVELVLSCLDSVPDSPPEDLLAKLGHRSDDVNGIREHLTCLLAPHVNEEFINSLTPIEDESDGSKTSPPSRPSSNSSASTEFSSRISPPPNPLRVPSPPSPPSSNRSTPTDPMLMANSDVDLRQILDRGFHPTGDVDMRTTDPRTAEDPRIVTSNEETPKEDTGKAKQELQNTLPESSTSKTSVAEPAFVVGGSRQSVIGTSTQLDPRIAMADPRRTMSNPSPMHSNGIDPRITQAYVDARDPRLGPAGNQMMGNNQHNFLGPARNPMMHNNFGMPFGNMGGIMNHQGPRMMNGPMMNGPMGPRLVNGNMNNGPFMGGMMGGVNMLGQGGMGPQWQNNMPQNRLGMMLPIHNPGQGIFPQASAMGL